MSFVLPCDVEDPRSGLNRQIATFFAQTTASWVVLVVLLVATDQVEGEPIDVPVGWMLGIVVTPILTNALVAALGLPLRFLGRGRLWLQRHGLIPLILGCAGIICVVVALVLRSPAQATIDGRVYDVYAAPIWVWTAGWLATAAGIVHATPPFRLGMRRAGEGVRGASGGSRTLGA